MKFYVAVTDPAWFGFLRELDPAVDEVNFWTTGPHGVSLPVGTPWLFKLRGRNVIAGGGYFTHSTQMPLDIAWHYFERKNGAGSFGELQNAISRAKGAPVNASTPIGCIVLSEPFFWERQRWLPAPQDWRPQTQRVKIYDAEEPNGRLVWQGVLARADRPVLRTQSALGKPQLIQPRLGQGGFRTEVLDAYGRRCAITGERALPALEAAHIVPFADVHAHDVRNGLLLRADIHNLFDWGYVTVSPDYRFLVSKSLRDEFENGRDYYALQNRAIALPDHPSARPDPTLLERHLSTVFRG